MGTTAHAITADLSDIDTIPAVVERIRGLAGDLDGDTRRPAADGYLHCINIEEIIAAVRARARR